MSCETEQRCDRSETGSMAVSGTSRDSVGSLRRLYLPKRHTLVAEKRCLPSGDCLPSWTTMSLAQKLPVFPTPTGTLELFRNKLCKPLYMNKQKVDFDLTDPNNYHIDSRYNALNDPHAKEYIRAPHVLRRLVQNGEITADNKVLCSVRELNQFRGWLRHTGLFAFHHQQREEREKETRLKELQIDDTCDLVSIENSLHQEDVRQRQLKHIETQQSKRRWQMYELERRMELTRLQREELQAQGTEAVQYRRTHRKVVYDRAARITHQKARHKLNKYRQKVVRHEQYLKDMETSRQNDSSQRLQEEWDKRKSFQEQYLENIKNSFEKEEDRASRYRNFFAAEMNRRWKAQADGIQARKAQAKMHRETQEEMHSRNLARAFAGSPVLNPTVRYTGEVAPSEERPPLSTEQSVVTDPGRCSQERGEEEETEGEEQEEVEEEAAEEGDLSAGQDLEAKIPPFISVHIDKRYGTEAPLSIEKPLAQMGLNIRLHPVNDMKSSEELNKVAKAIAYVRKQVSGKSLNTLPGLGTSGRPYSKGAQSPSVDSCQGQGFYTVASVDEGGTQGYPLDYKTSMFEMLTEEDREGIEDLLNRLLKDLSEGRLDQDDFIRLTSWCAALTSSQLTEQATSTTSLDLAREARIKAMSPSIDRESKERSDSLLSTRLDSYLGDTLERVEMEIEESDEALGMNVVEDTIRNTVTQLSQDLHDGTLSREDVREIGSAVASVIEGEVRSDSSVMAEDVVVPTLQQLLNEMENIDDVLLDQAMASMLCSYKQVTKLKNKVVWQIIRDFAVEVLLRTRMALSQGCMDTAMFLQCMETCKKTPLQKELDIPSQFELLPVVTTAISKLRGVRTLCPVVCDLMKIVLDQGQPILVHRNGPDKYCVPNIDMSKLEATACGLQVALEVAATVADGLYRDLLGDARFEDRLRQALAPHFLLALLTAWGEMTAAVDTETLGLQTSEKDLVSKPSLSEYVLLMAFNQLWKDVLNDQLPTSVIIHLALHLAEFPALVQLSSVINPDDHGKITFPPYVISKMCRLKTMIEEQEVDFIQSKKMLAVVLHIYLRQVLLQCRCSVSPVVLHDEPKVRKEVTGLVIQVARKVLISTQDLVTRKLSKNKDFNRNGDVAPSTDTLQALATEGLREIKKNVEKGLSPAQLKDMQLQDLITASILAEDDTDTQMFDVPGFLMTIVRRVEQSWHYNNKGAAGGEELFHTASTLLRTQLARVADSVANRFAEMTVLHQCISKPSPVLQQMVSFLVSLLLQLRSALQEGILDTDVTLDFLQDVACELCPLEMKTDRQSLAVVIMDMVRHIGWRKDRSVYFGRLVRNLSQLSLNRKQHEEVAESMAATAHMLASVNTNVLNNFIQTTLLSLLHSMKEHRQECKAAASELSSAVAMVDEPGHDATNNRRPTPQDTALPKAAAVTVTKATCVSPRPNTQHDLGGVGEELGAGGPAVCSRQGQASTEEDDRLPGLSGRVDSASCGAHDDTPSCGHHEMVPGCPVDSVPGRLDDDSTVRPLMTATPSKALVQENHADSKRSSFTTNRSSLSVLQESKMEILDHASRQEINQQTNIIVHTVVQTTLDRLGANSSLPFIREDLTDNVISLLVTGCQDVTPGSSPDTAFCDLDPSIMSYAQELYESVSRHMETEDNAKVPESGGQPEGNAGPMAALIIGSTLKTAATKLSTGALDAAGMSCSRRSSYTIFQDSPIPSLSSCIVHTLCAVQSELDVRHRNATSTMSQADTTTHSGLHNLQQAKKIVEFLISKVNRHSENTKHTALNTSVSREISEAPVKPVVYIWESSSAEISGVILQTFLDVVDEMHIQNQFFNPDMKDNIPPIQSNTDDFILPSLPFLMDEFILNNLHRIALQLIKQTSGAETAAHDLPADAINVACNLRAVVKTLMERSMSQMGLDQWDSDRENKQTYTLTVLDKALQRLLHDGLDAASDTMLSPEEGRTGSARKLPTSESNASVRGRSYGDVKKDVKTLVGTTLTVDETIRHRAYSTGTKSAEDVSDAKRVVVQAFNQILTYVEDNRCSEYDINYLCSIFRLKIAKDSSMDSKREALIEDTRSLINATESGRIPDAKLLQIADGINVLDRRNARDDPRKIAQVVRKVSCPSTNSEFLKIAVADLLWGLNVNKGAVNSLHELSQAKLAVPSNDTEEPAHPSDDISIVSRTVSKIMVTDNASNREINYHTVFSSVYPSQVMSSSLDDTKSTHSSSAGTGQISADSVQSGKAPVVCFQDLNITQGGPIPNMDQVDGSEMDAQTAPEAESTYDNSNQSVLYSASENVNLTRPDVQVRVKQRSKEETATSDSRLGNINKTKINYRCTVYDDSNLPMSDSAAVLIRAQELYSRNYGKAKGCRTKGTKMPTSVQTDTVPVCRTVSESSRDSKGSSTTLSAPNEDYNSSAIRMTHQSYTACFDHVQGNEAGTREQEALAAQVKLTKCQTVKPKATSEDRLCKSAAGCRRVAVRSELLAMADQHDRQSRPVCEKTVRTAQECQGWMPNSRRKVEHHQRNNSCGRIAEELEPTTAVQEYGHLPWDNTKPLGDTSRTAQLLMSEVGDSLGSHPTQSTANAWCKQNEEKQEEEPSIQADRQCIVRVQKKSSGESRSETDDKKFAMVKKALKREVSSYPLLKAQHLGCAFKGRRQLEEQVRRAQERVFALGMSLFDPVLKEKRLREQKKKENQRLRKAMAAAVQNTLSNLPQVPVQWQQEGEFRHPLPHPQPLVSRLPSCLPSDGHKGCKGQVSVSSHKKLPFYPACPHIPHPQPPVQKKPRTRCPRQNRGIVKDSNLSDPSWSRLSKGNFDQDGTKSTTRNNIADLAATSCQRVCSIYGKRPEGTALKQRVEEKPTKVAAKSDGYARKPKKPNAVPGSEKSTLGYCSQGKSFRSQSSVECPIRRYSYSQRSMAEQPKDTTQCTVRQGEQSKNITQRSVVDHSKNITQRSVAEQSKDITQRSVAEQSKNITQRSVVDQSKDITQCSVAEQSKNITQRSVVDQSKDITQRSVAEQSKDITQRSVAEQSKDITQRSVAEQSKDITQRSVAEQYKDITQRSVVDQSKNITQRSVAEQSKDITQRSVAEQSKNITQRSVVDQSKDITQRSVAEQSKNITQRTVVDQSKDITQRSVAEQSKDITQRSVAEQSKDITQRSVAEQSKDIMQRSVAEHYKDITQRSVAEQSKDITQRSVAEQSKNITERSVAEQSKDITQRSVAEQSKDITQRSVAEQSKDITQRSVAEQSKDAVQHKAEEDVRINVAAEDFSEIPLLPQPPYHTASTELSRQRHFLTVPPSTLASPLAGGNRSQPYVPSGREEKASSASRQPKPTGGSKSVCSRDKEDCDTNDNGRTAPMYVHLLQPNEPSPGSQSALVPQPPEGCKTTHNSCRRGRILLQRSSKKDPVVSGTEKNPSPYSSLVGYH